MMIGSIINTPHGRARVLGFERFDKDGMTAPLGNTWRGSERIICELLPNHTWCFNGNYGLYAHEYKELNK